MCIISMLIRYITYLYNYYYNNKLQNNLYKIKYRTLRKTNIYIIRKITEDLLNQAFTYGTIII